MDIPKMFRYFLKCLDMIEFEENPDEGRGNEGLSVPRAYSSGLGFGKRYCIPRILYILSLFKDFP